MRFPTILMAAFVGLLLIGHPTEAGITTKLAKEGSRLLLRKGAQATASQTARRVATQSTKTLARNAATKAAQRSTAAATRHFGDDLVRTGSTFSSQLAAASAKLTAKQQRRLAIMAKGMTQSGKTSMVSKVAAAAKPGSMVDDLWRLHKGKFAAGVAGGTVLIHGDDIAKAGSEFIAKPLIESAFRHIAAPVVRFISIATLILLVLAGVTTACSAHARQLCTRLLMAIKTAIASRRSPLADQN